MPNASRSVRRAWRRSIVAKAHVTLCHFANVAEHREKRSSDVGPNSAGKRMSQSSLQTSSERRDVEPSLELPGGDIHWTAWRIFFLLLGPALGAAIALLPSGLQSIEGFGSRPAYAAAVSTV